MARHDPAHQILPARVCLAPLPLLQFLGVLFLLRPLSERQDLLVRWRR
jgi:hypothetical protein